MLALGQAMRRFTPSSSEFASVPVGELQLPGQGLGSTVKWDERRPTKLFEALREDRPLAPAPAPGSRAPDGDGPVDVPPQQIRVQVENGTRMDGLGRRVDAALRATGFDTTRAPRNGAGARRHAHADHLRPALGPLGASLATALPGRGCGDERAGAGR